MHSAWNEYLRKVPWMLAGKIFKLFQEANSSPPALSFGSWANALQAVLRSRGMYSKGPEIVEAIFKTFLPRAQEQLGITDDDARKQMASTMAGWACCDFCFHGGLRGPKTRSRGFASRSNAYSRLHCKVSGRSPWEQAPLAATPARTLP